MERLIINLCPTGAVTNKQLTPYVPLSPAEIVNDVLICSQAGASIIHIHACDLDGIPTYKKEVYSEIIAGIRSHRPDLIIVVTTSGRLFSEFEQRSQVLELKNNLKPDMASLTLGSLNFAKHASTNSPEVIMRLLEKMQLNDIKPELEIFDVGMINYANYLIKKGLLEPPYYFNILLGNIATAQAKIHHLSVILSEMPDNSIWSVAGIGTCQKNMNLLGLITGDGVRVGLEDNIWFDDNKKIMATNLSLVERVVKMAEIMGRQIATPDEVRERLNLKQSIIKLCN